MMRSKLRIFLILFSISQFVWAAEDIELPAEELAKETVLPVFERPGIVRMRNVTTDGKFEMGLNFGWLMTEPIFNTSRFGLSAYYHTTENSAWGAQFYYNSSDFSDYTSQLKKLGLDFSGAPKPEYMLYLDYNAKLFYGKLSIAKNTTINTHLMGLLSAGMTKFENASYPGVSTGLGYKMYFNPHLSFRTDLRLYVHQAPIPFKSASATTYKERIHYTNVLDMGLHYLF